MFENRGSDVPAVDNDAKSQAPLKPSKPPPPLPPGRNAASAIAAPQPGPLPSAPSPTPSLVSSAARPAANLAQPLPPAPGRPASIRPRAAVGGAAPYCGIGLFIEQGAKGCRVTGIEPGSAAQLSGQICVGDFFLKVGGPDPPRSAPAGPLARCAAPARPRRRNRTDGRARRPVRGVLGPAQDRLCHAAN